MGCTWYSLMVERIVLKNKLNLCRDHIKKLTDKYPDRYIKDVLHEKDCFEWYDTKNGIGHILVSILRKEDYWDTLHEFAHIELSHKAPQNWDDEVRMEIEAWEYVIKNSVVKIPESVIISWNEERLQGSWE